MNVYVWNVEIYGESERVCKKRKCVESERVLNVKPSVESECV